MNICQRCKKPTKKTIALNDASDFFCSRVCQEADEREFEQSLRPRSDAKRLDELEQQMEGVQLPWTAHESTGVHESWNDETFMKFGKRVAELWSILAGPGEIASDAYVYEGENARLIVDAVNALPWLISLARRGLTSDNILKLEQETRRQLIWRAEKYEKALRFYADKRHYIRDGLHALPYIQEDGGKVAHEALNSNPFAETSRRT